MSFGKPLLLCFAAGILLMLTACSGNSKPAPAAKQPPPTVPKPVSDVTKLLNNVGLQIGQDVTLNDVAVMKVEKQERKGDNVIWVGPAQDQLVMVVFKDSAVPPARGKPQPVLQGGVVSIAGTAKKPPDARKAEIEWHLDKASAEQLEKTGIYIEASSVMPQGG